MNKIELISNTTNYCGINILMNSIVNKCFAQLNSFSLSQEMV